MKKTIIAHCLVKNEARFIWYSVMSVVNHVDKVLLWDTGSTDGTVEIIKEVIKASPGKIDFREVGSVDIYGYEKIRQELLAQTTTDWFIVVDGDEIWWEESIRKVVQVVKSSTSRNIESIIVPTYNLVGDIFHYQEEAAGQYRLAGRKGHFSLRVVNRKIPGLNTKRPHGTSGFFDKDGRLIQDRNPKKILFVDAPYIHATHIPRALERTREFEVPKRTQKLKYEIGIPFPRDFYYPEVFFRLRPEIVPSPWIKRSLGYTMRATFETPLKRIKRRIIKGTKIGY